MDDVTETFPELFHRRMSELGTTTVREMWKRLPDSPGRTSYETIRNLANGKQRTVIRQRVLDDLVLILQVPENEIRATLSRPARLGEWTLPPRAQSLDSHEREVVIAVIDALLRAKTPKTDSSHPMTVTVSDEVIKARDSDDAVVMVDWVKRKVDQLRAELHSANEEVEIPQPPKVSDPDGRPDLIGELEESNEEARRADNAVARDERDSSTGDSKPIPRNTRRS